VEHYGDRMDVMMKIGSHRMVARTGPDVALREGASVTFSIDLQHAHLFEAGDAGTRIA